MCGEIFWKKILVFGLTFGLGVAVSVIFTANKIPSPKSPMCDFKITKLPAEDSNPVIETVPAPQAKNCVPLDKSLEYQLLTAEEKQKTETERQLNNRKSLGGTKLEDLKAGKPPVFDRSKNPVEVKILVHQERCFEIRDQK